MKKRPEKRLQWFLTTVVKVLWICDHFRLGQQQQQQHHHTLSYKTSSNPKENRSFILIEETSNKFSPSNWKRKVSGSIPLHVVSCLAKKTLTHLPRLWTINWEEPGSILRHQYKYPFTKKLLQKLRDTKSSSSGCWRTSSWSGATTSPRRRLRRMVEYLETVLESSDSKESNMDEEIAAVVSSSNDRKKHLSQDSAGKTSLYLYNSLAGSVRIRTSLNIWWPGLN